MASDLEGLRKQLAAAQAEALRVGDSPLRADRLADGIDSIVRGLDGVPLSDEQQARLLSALADALRVLRRDDDGREAARHLQKALAAIEARERRPSPFLDD